MIPQLFTLFNLWHIFLFHSRFSWFWSKNSMYRLGITFFITFLDTFITILLLFFILFQDACDYYPFILDYVYFQFDLLRSKSYVSSSLIGIIKRSIRIVVWVITAMSHCRQLIFEIAIYRWSRVASSASVYCTLRLCIQILTAKIDHSYCYSDLQKFRIQRHRHIVH